MEDKWLKPPDQEDVYRYYRDRAAVQAAIRVLELEIEVEEKKIQAQHPRNTSFRFLGENDNLIRKRFELAQLKNKLDHINAEIQFLEYWKDMFKSCVFMTTK